MYKQGSENRVADALSRRQHDNEQCLSISVVSPQWLQEIVASYDNDDRAKLMQSKLAVSEEAVPNFKPEAGILKYKSRIWMGNNQLL